MFNNFETLNKIKIITGTFIILKRAKLKLVNVMLLTKIIVYYLCFFLETCNTIILFILTSLAHGIYLFTFFLRFIPSKLFL